MKCVRTAFAKRLADLAEKDARIFALEGDLKESTQSVIFEKAHPERYVECGIAEQNMVTVAAGMALAGKVPFCHSFAAFISMRACEQVRTSVAYPKLNVKLVGTHAGLSAGSAGSTHHAIEDIAIMSAIPGMKVFAPGDAFEAAACADAMMSFDGPAYVRLGAAEYEPVFDASYRMTVGKAVSVRDGNDCTIATTGSTLNLGIRAAELLKKEHGIDAGVLHFGTVKPLDAEAVRVALAKTGCIVTVEEHTVIGGFGAAVAQVAACEWKGKVISVGIEDRFPSVIGGMGYLWKHVGLTEKMISETVSAALERR